MWLLFLKLNIPTERPLLVDEVSDNFCGWSGVMWSAQRVLTAVNLDFSHRIRYSSFN
jgi:hypothetical protein